MSVLGDDEGAGAGGFGTAWGGSPCGGVECGSPLAPADGAGAGAGAGFGLGFGFGPAFGEGLSLCGESSTWNNLSNAPLNFFSLASSGQGNFLVRSNSKPYPRHNSWREATPTPFGVFT